MRTECRMGAVNASSECQRICKHKELDEIYSVVFEVVFPVLIVLGIISNVVNLIVLTRPRMMNKIYRWLRTLAVVDICLCVLTTPVCMANSGHTPSGVVLAKYYSMFGWSLSIGSQIVSFYLMVWFAYDRYLAVCCHERYPKSLRYEKFRGRVIFTITFVVILYAPTMFVGLVCPVDGGWKPLDGYRNIEEGWYKAYSWIREIFSRLVPAGFMTIFNIKIALRLKHLRSIRDGFANGVPPSRRDKERKLVVLLFWVTAFFYIYNTPVAVYYLVFLNHDILPADRENDVLTFGVISNLVQMIGNVSNFTVYFFINPEYQKTLKGLCCRSPSKANGLDVSEVSQSYKGQQASHNNTLRSLTYGNSVNDISSSGVHVAPKE
ncbi:probable G-protein coupled receptor B0563.6 [Macrobrachium rosenbergii]|uniref:probable G-protein coupled receptor B0563.6 n=1 Tax=Macrobrachium rosenbergii TaxID=79674 RepID=UPI0034D5A7FF